MVQGPSTDVMMLHSLIKGAALGHTQTAVVALYTGEGACIIMRTTAVLDRGGLMKDADVCRLVMTRAETGKNSAKNECDLTFLPPGRHCMMITHIQPSWAWMMAAWKSCTPQAEHVSVGSTHQAGLHGG